MSINISTNSWHYKMAYNVWDFFGKSLSNSLCGYFWQVVFAPIVAIGCTLIVSAICLLLATGAFYVSGAMVGPALAHFGILPDTFLDKGPFNWRFVILSIIIDLIIVAYFLVKNYIKKHKKVKNTTKQSNIVIEFVKSKKQKICPLIKFIDK